MEISDLKLVTLRHTTQFLDSLKETKKGTIISTFPTINGVEIEFYKEEDEFKFRSNGITHHEGDPAPVEYQAWNYGYSQPFAIKSDKDEIYILEKGVGDYIMNLKQHPSTSGEIKEIECALPDILLYHRNIQLIDENSKRPNAIFAAERFKIEEFLYTGCVSLKINQHNYGLFDCRIGDKPYLVIDALTPITLDDFEPVVEAINYVFALISGCLNRENRLIIQSITDDYSEVRGFKYSKLPSSILSSLELINPGQLYEFLEYEQSQRFSKEVFSKLVELCIEDKRLLRAIKIITQSRNLPLEQSVASYFVAMETVKNIIIIQHSDKLKSFKSDKMARRFIRQLKEIIENIGDEEFNNKEAVLKMLDNINRPLNKDSFLKVFEIVGIDLSELDRNCVKQRDIFLHGNVPLEDETNQFKMSQILSIMHKSHFLTCALILKYAGFEGYIKNSLKFVDVFKYDNSINEELFVKI